MRYVCEPRSERHHELDTEIAEAVEWVLGRPESVDVNEILIRPIGQAV